MNRIARIVIALLWSLSLAHTARAQVTINGVPPNYTTIQSAILVTVNGDTVFVGPGIYPENIDFLGKLITLISPTPHAATIDGGGGILPTVRFVMGETNLAVLDGFKIVNGGYDQFALDGAGIRCRGSSPIIQNCQISGNGGGAFLGDGGGIYCGVRPLTGLGSAPTIVNCDISSNLARAGGGVYSTASSPTLTNCRIFNHSVTFDGGGIYATNSTMIIDYTDVSGNIANDRGGGLFSTSVSCKIRFSSFVSNLATNLAGGGVYMEAGAFGSRILANDSTFRSNTAGLRGGGLFLLGINSIATQSVVTSCELIDNTAGTDGGGIACIDSSPWVHANTFDGNNCDDYGGGMYVQDDSDSLIEENSFLNFNRAYNSGGGIAIRSLSLPGSAAPIVRGNSILDSRCGSEGAGIYVSASSAIINGNIIQDGGAHWTGLPIPFLTATQRGGGIAVDSDPVGSPTTLEHNTIAGNYAELDGGGVYLKTSNTIVSDNTMSRNGRLTGGPSTVYTQNGGGLYVESGEPQIDGNVILSNQVAPTLLGFGGKGGGACIINPGANMLFTDNFIVKNWAHVGTGGGLYYTNTLPATLFHNTIASNTNADSQTAPTAYGKGNALYVDGTGLLVIRNSIVRGPRLPLTFNSLAIVFNATTPPPDVYHSCTGPVFVAAAWFEDGALVVDPILPGATVTHDFPLFVNPAVDDFHLDVASPCIDTGDSTVPGITPTDMDGDPRPTPTTIVDMGADERP